ncbi:MAG: phosphatidate cytidylyltransferase, partial [Chloroflexota bacterium]|nr:phosphatidate cytidylyltransferase [Chloroflexota bacterium]
MLRTRFLTAIVLLPIAFWCISLGATPFLILVASLLTLAEIEFCQLMTRGGFRPTTIFGLGLVWLFLMDAQLSTQFPALELLRPGLALLVLGSLGWQLFHRRSSPVADWALTVTGGLYLGLCGACLIGLRSLQPGGLWWTVTAVPAVMFADTGAFFFGRAWGRHK